MMKTFNQFILTQQHKLDEMSFSLGVEMDFTITSAGNNTYYKCYIGDIPLKITFRFFKKYKDYHMDAPVSTENMVDVPVFIENMVDVTFKRDDQEGWGIIPSGGAAITIFSVVLEALRQYLKGNSQVETIEFSADFSEPSRVKLYDRFFKQAEKYLTGFTNKRIINSHSAKWYFLSK